MGKQVFGTSVHVAPALRDTVLAGVFSAAVTWAATQKPLGFVFGLVSGGLLGFVLHLLPPEPEPGDSRGGRIATRAITGTITGICLTPGLSWVAHGTMFDADLAPRNSDRLQAGALGGALALVWYVLWGLWETRPGRPALAQA